MKNTVKVVNVKFNNEFENKNGIKQHTLQMLLVEPIMMGRVVKNDDERTEKVLKMSDRLVIDFKSFLKLIVMDDDLSQLDPMTSENEEWDKKMTEMYSKHLGLLRGAEITLKREEITAPVYEVDESGEIRLDEDGNPTIKIDGDKPVTKMIGFGETTFLDIKLTNGAQKRLAVLLEKQDD